MHNNVIYIKRKEREGDKKISKNNLDGNARKLKKESQYLCLVLLHGKCVLFFVGLPLPFAIPFMSETEFK